MTSFLIPYVFGNIIINMLFVSLYINDTGILSVFFANYRSFPATGDM